MNKISIKKIPKKILVIKPSSLGDIVHSLPFLNAVKDTFPSAEIHWVVAKGLEGLLENHPMVKRPWIINKDQWKNLKGIKETVIEFKGLFKKLGDESYDIVIDLQGLLRSGILTYITRSPVRVGFKEAREGSSLFYTHKVRGGMEIHAVDRYLKIASAVGCEVEDVKFPMPLIKESENVKKLKEDIGDYAVLVPGARWKTKRWLPANFGKLASMLDIKTVIVGSSSDTEIAKGIEFCSGGKVLSMAGKSDIKELISIIRGARYVITNDSGPMHIAAAFGIPVVAIFGPTNPVRTGPYGKNNIIVKSDISCAPCYKKNCKSVKCMDDVSVEEVYEAVMSIC
jgi:lipopolysaccharide heptosyltransferase I